MHTTKMAHTNAPHRNEVGQLLLLQSATPFETIADTLYKLGWTRENESDSPALIQGEPEMVAWSLNGQKPYVIYTFNPVVKMRTLDVATVPPAMREHIAKQLPILEDKEVESLFESTDARERLLALWAAQETDRLDLAGKVQAREDDAEPIVAEQAKEVSQRLQNLESTRTNMLAQLRILGESSAPLIEQLCEPDFIASLKPSREDLAELFDPALTDIAEQCVELIYQQRPHISPLQADSKIEVWAAPAGLLRWPNMLSRKFPTGYRDMAGWMNPHRVWLTWTISTPAGGSVRYDGLVWLNDRWLWLPKIFRLLCPYLLGNPTQH